MNRSNGEKVSGFVFHVDYFALEEFPVVWSFFVVHLKYDLLGRYS